LRKKTQREHGRNADARKGYVVENCEQHAQRAAEIQVRGYAPVKELFPLCKAEDGDEREAREVDHRG
jgi:hypothetical protein